MEEISTMMVRSALPGKNLTSAPSSAAATIAESLQGSTMRSSSTSSDVSPIRMTSEDRIAAVTGGGLRKTVSILAIAPTKMQVPSETGGATVFVGAGGTSSVAATNGAANAPANWRQTSIPEVEAVNGYGTRQHQDNQKELKQQLRVTSVVGTGTPQQQQQQQSSPSHQSGQHVVKIRINPELETGRVISTVRLNPELTDEGSVSAVKSSVKQSFNEDNGTNIDRDDSSGETDVWTRRDNAIRLSGLGVTNEAAGQSETRVRISVVSSSLGSERNNENQRHDLRVEKALSLENRETSKQQDEMIQQCATTNETINGSSINRGSSACFYYGSFPNSLTSMMTSSGQCSPSDTLDSGTCSDLDGTPPPLPKKKNSSTVLLGVNGGSSVIGKTIGNVASQKGQHNRTGSVTSSGAELDSDDNESNISCDSLNSGDLASRIIEHQSVRVNGIALVGSVDKIAKTDSHEKTNNGEGHRDVENSRVTSGDEVSVKNVDGKLDHHREIIDENEHTDDLQNNNNTSKNNNNNLSKNEDNDGMSLNGSKVIVDEEMNERNNGKAEVTTDTAVLPSEVISPSSSSSTSVSPSPSGVSSLSKASSTPRVQSPVSNGRSSPLSSSPMVKECTYEERKREQDRINEESAAADYYANYNRKNGTKYLYDDDRFYKFHINENQSDNENDEDAKIEDKESDEFFAGYKILDREAIRSAKGTVRGVKNRVRAGIATFLQKSSTKVSLTRIKPNQFSHYHKRSQVLVVNKKTKVAIFIDINFNFKKPKSLSNELL